MISMIFLLGLSLLGCNAKEQSLPQGNLLKNADFEKGAIWWTPYNEVNLQTTGTVHSGKFALLSSDRANHYAGPSQNITTSIQQLGPGKYYTEAYVYTHPLYEGEYYINVRLRDANGDNWFTTPLTKVPGGEFVKLSGYLDLSWSGQLDDALFYIESSTDTSEPFVIDDVVLKISNELE